MNRTTRAAQGILLAVAVAGFITLRPTQARPPYATKEGVSCAYCHIKPEGGGARNYRGKYYGRKKLSFEGFDDYAAAIGSKSELGPEAASKPVSAGDYGAVTKAHMAVTTAQAAHEKAPDDAAAKKAYVDALTGLSHAILEAKTIPPAPRFDNVLKTANDALGFDPGNAAAKADKEAAEAGLKDLAEKEKAKAAATAAP